MSHISDVLQKIKNNNELKKIINQSKDFNSFFEEVERTEIINDFNLIEFFYRQPEVVESELKKIGFHFNTNLNTKKTTSLEKDKKSKEYGNQMKYRLIPTLEGKWQQVEAWMEFFFKLGEFISKQSTIDLYINYIDDSIPSLFISLGVIHTALTEMSSEKKEVVEIEEGLEVGPGDEVAYFDGNKWRRAVITAIERDENAYAEKFNPYIRLQVDRARGNNTLESVPRTLWNKKIRISANFKKTNGSVVRLNDDLSENLILRHGTEACEKLKFYNDKYVNLIGNGIENNLEEIIKLFQFKDEKGIFTLSDYIYFNNRTLNYSNVNIIKSDKFEVNNTDGIISMFVGSSSALNLNEYKTQKNIYIINRKRVNLLNNEVLETQISQDMLNQKTDNSYKELQNFLSSYKLEVPKGCELNVY